jgi:hypothetical protein
MIPVTQTKVVVKNSKGEYVVRGNCMAAVVASILEIPISEVPNIETLFHVNETLWIEVLHAWLKSHGYEWSTDQRFKVFHDDEFAMKEGNRPEYWDACKNKYYLACGLSPRKIMHVCIYENGKLVFDPHPSREGLETIEHFEVIEKLND